MHRATGPVAGLTRTVQRAIVADLDDIIESKEALARKSDLVALPELQRLRARQAR